MQTMGIKNELRFRGAQPAREKNEYNLLFIEENLKEPKKLRHQGGKG